MNTQRKRAVSTQIELEPDLILLWAMRMRRFTANDLAAVTERPVRECARAISQVPEIVESGNAREYVLSPAVDDIDRRWRGELWTSIWPQPVPMHTAIARTLAFAERHLGRMEQDPEKHPGLRRYMLFCLSSMLLPCGPIDQVEFGPWSERRRYRIKPRTGEIEAFPEPSEEEKRRAEARAKRASRLRSRAEEIQDRYYAAAPAVNPIEVLASFEREPDPNWPPLPESVEEFVTEPRRSDALIARFGIHHQLLAGSKSRLPWSRRCVFNGGFGFADAQTPQEEEFWWGDFWFYPPPNANNDPRRAAADIARFYGRGITAWTEFGLKLWTAHPDGTFEVHEHGRMRAEIHGRELDKSGWPLAREYPIYPTEFLVGDPDTPRYQRIERRTNEAALSAK